MLKPRGFPLKPAKPLNPKSLKPQAQSSPPNATVSEAHLGSSLLGGGSSVAVGVGFALPVLHSSLAWLTF